MHSLSRFKGRHIQLALLVVMLLCTVLVYVPSLDHSSFEPSDVTGEPVASIEQQQKSHAEAADRVLQQSNPVASSYSPGQNNPHERAPQLHSRPRHGISARIINTNTREERAKQQLKRKPRDEFFHGLAATFKTQPFYHSATKVKKLEYFVTIVTQSSVDRLDKIALMADRWRAPISVALLIRDANVDLPKLDKILANNTLLREFADIHLFHANKTRYPVNNLRNLAITSSRTDFVLLMDADFIIPAGTHDYLIPYIHAAQSNEDKVAFVFPAFSSSYEPSLLPNDKASLLELIQKGLVSPSNLENCPKCHSPTNYERWYKESKAYQLDYRWIYEPYLLFNRSQTELFDERFKGYGFDKNSQVFAMAVMGFKFLVQPDSYIIHINHEQSKWDGEEDIVEQQWDALRVLCDLIPSVKQRYGYEITTRVFDEPLPFECYSDQHW
ncbi:hypothetical protein SAMD00019534_122450 [Acytostelium subglobosum LB1]|uniref:hypothetical protein n=1 Tax=Acytostelium subglobosum LB1 TaxID=1410327 RepID=UPI0006447ACA|nr:hypothetical protein SAMD00019534_122450 [Acytostelium subglobosum LB1]GAM29069.1 hypothetical protein SAMD00019534_122450 [Acytostelium subglobosum LB1]|eukprot:XP_012747914.1 hypothetical protein SAMD00019534_122450 [Acytostelium subglobosum LB1]